MEQKENKKAFLARWRCEQQNHHASLMRVDDFKQQQEII